MCATCVYALCRQQRAARGWVPAWRLGPLITCAAACRTLREERGREPPSPTGRNHPLGPVRLDRRAPQPPQQRLTVARMHPPSFAAGGPSAAPFYLLRPPRQPAPSWVCLGRVRPLPPSMADQHVHVLPGSANPPSATVAPGLPGLFGAQQALLVRSSIIARPYSIPLGPACV